MIDRATPAGVTVARGSVATRADRLAAALADGYGIESAHLHIDSVTPSPDRTPQEALASAIAAEVPDDHLLVVESERADRWQSRQSVAEHVIDAHRNMSAAIGPAADGSIGTGPVVVALDGSPTADAALPAAAGLSNALGRHIVLVRVVPAPLHGTAADETEAAAAMLRQRADTIEPNSSDGGPTGDIDIEVVESNDPVSGLVDLCNARKASFIALASSGDRETVRSTMSRTAAGLIAEAPCPVFIAHSGSA